MALPIHTRHLCRLPIHLKASTAPRSFTVRTMAMASQEQRYKLIFTTPPQHLPTIKTAVFATGAGSYPGPGGYTEVCFTMPGVGQFRPGNSANPAVGEKGKLEEVGEVRCEILCVGEGIARQAVEALKQSHPYEEPAYEVYKLENF
ncbi:hypothetical protein D0865_08649 [Hortaea werneckii]|uniref:ATP phosphoribosyltransferase n=1 Tax=Hortaea werneckii TaxID=91943 RepID=A0A3M7C6I2_HORWE|nr:hypothetical protein D0865_08649 [Hortaea werneckii]